MRLYVFYLLYIHAAVSSYNGRKQLYEYEIMNTYDLIAEILELKREDKVFVYAMRWYISRFCSYTSQLASETPLTTQITMW